MAFASPRGFIVHFLDFNIKKTDLSELFTVGANGGCNVAIVFIVEFITDADFISYYISL